MIKSNIIKKYIDFSDDIKSNDKIFREKIHSKKVLIIGGAGTIASNYIKEILHFKPKKIVIVDTNENGLTELARDLRSSHLLDYNPEFITYPINLLSNTFDKVFWSDDFDIISNFSAHKHVRSEKDIISIEALIKNNVYGAIKLLELCSNRHPNFFFSVSTDKAANPVNIMGASKSLMEKLIISKKNDFRVSTSRFANVAFSNGSLLDGFIYRINKKQPLSCPVDIKRFFVSPKQSGQICLIATFLGESGSIFFPKLDPLKHQIYFKDIALDFLEKNGFKPVLFYDEKGAKSFDINENSNKYPIYLFKSDTSGEKSFEEFFTNKEKYHINDFKSLGYIESQDIKISFDKLKKDFESVFSNQSSSKKDLIKVIKKYILDFNHIETGKNLDQKM